jgi:hypothetical protein
MTFLSLAIWQQLLVLLLSFSIAIPFLLIGYFLRQLALDDNNQNL